ncbi:MAG: phospholipase [Burkholderiaceae bacterium]|jgi:phospholipase/lecithinase/hemolysin|nr:phospholipase [Burkholderiaceae bacterium]
MKGVFWKLATLAVVAALSACGSGGSQGPGSATGITSVKVMGDSLSDSGTFAGVPGYGRIFSVQGSSAEPNVGWTERVNANLGLAQLCSFFRFTGTSFNSTPGCTSFAVGGGRINAVTQTGGQQGPFSVVYQLQTAAMVNGEYVASDLLLLDGGANDAADLVGAYLATAKDGGASYQALLLSLLPAATVEQLLGQGSTGLAQAGGAYMIALADLFYNTLKTQALDKGAQHVAVLNIPAITLTPRLQMALGGVAAAQGEAVAEQTKTLFDSWVKAFNAQLVQNVGSDKRIVLVDFYTSFVNQWNSPAQYGLSNMTVPVCPATGVGADGLPTYTFETCTAQALSANPPEGSLAPDWWQTYAFADSFHPTPYGYQLMSQMVSEALAKAGWF